MFNAGVTRSFPGKSRIEEDLEKTKVIQPFICHFEASRSAQRAMMQALEIMANRMDHIDRKLSGMMLTGPNG